MTRGNQRDTDRARAEARAKAGKSNSTIKSAESTADIMRKKQEAADAKKEGGGGLGTLRRRRRGGEDGQAIHSGADAAQELAGAEEEGQVR